MSPDSSRAGAQELPRSGLHSLVAQWISAATYVHEGVGPAPYHRSVRIAAVSGGTLMDAGVMPGDWQGLA